MWKSVVSGLTTILKRIRPSKKAFLSFTLTVLGLGLAVIAGGYIWRGYFSVQLAGWALTSVFAVAYIFYRGTFRKAELPRTGMEWVFALGVMVLMGSWILSPDPRQGLGRVGWLLSCLILFYLLVDALETNAERQAVLAGVLWISGLLVALAVLETYARYQQWWQISGWGALPPFPYRFVGLLGHPNALMGMANLCAPLALVTFLNARTLLGRLGAGVWSLFYLLALPFSSSRGGWLGFAAWVGFFFLLWTWETRPWQTLRERFRRRVAWLAPLAVIILTVLAWSGYRFWVSFATHPSHGSNPFGGRIDIWMNAVEIWRISPLFGAGPGRFGYEYFYAEPGTPPVFWALHAHNLYLQVLAEFGLMGFAALVLLLVAGAVWLWKRYLGTPDQERNWSGAILAGLASWLVQMVFDDQSSVVPVMGIVVLWVAWVATANAIPFRRWMQISINILVLPTFLLIAGVGLGLWAYYPMNRGLVHAQQNEWERAATWVAEGQRRDPNLAFYAAEEGLAQAYAWQQSGDSRYLERARAAFEHSLDLEPSPSIWLANLSVLDWHAGDSNSAMLHIGQAILRSPREPSYPLNLGWYYEQRGLWDMARNYYWRSLELSPKWAAHPFWQLTSFRQEIANEWRNSQPAAAAGVSAYWRQAQQAVAEGDYARARKLLAAAEWLGEPGLDVLAVKAGLAEAQGDLDQALEYYRQMGAQANRRNLNSSNSFAITYTLWLYNRNGLAYDLVPGYLQLTSSSELFAALERYYTLLVSSKRCEQAAQAWQDWQTAMRGGSLEPIPAAPPCPDR